MQEHDLLAAAQQRAEQAEAEMMRLQALLDTERLIPLGRYAFYHRHRALAYVRKVNHELHQEASNAANAEIDSDGGKSFDDVVAALEAERDAALAVAADTAEQFAEYRAHWEPLIKRLGDEHTQQGGELAILRRLALALCDSEIAYKRSLSIVSRAALNALRRAVEGT